MTLSTDREPSTVDLTQIYMTSPDWIKALLIAAPFATVIAIACILRPRPAVLTAGQQKAPDPRPPLIPTSIEGIDEEELRYFAHLLAESCRSRLPAPEKAPFSLASGKAAEAPFGHEPGPDQGTLPPER